MERLLSYEFIYLVPLTISAIVSIRAFTLRWPLSYKVFSTFLVLTLFVEIFAILWKWVLCKTSYWEYPPSNMWIYDGFVTVRYLFLAVYFYLILQYRVAKIILLISSSLLLIFAFINYFYIQSPHNVNTFTIIPANIFIVFMVLAFFHQILIEDQVIKLSSSADVWISLGTFIYHSGSLPFFIFFNYLIETSSPFLDSFLYINDFLNITMYTNYSIAFLCNPQFQK